MSGPLWCSIDDALLIFLSIMELQSSILKYGNSLHKILSMYLVNSRKDCLSISNDKYGKV